MPPFTDIHGGTCSSWKERKRRELRGWSGAARWGQGVGPEREGWGKAEGRMQNK